MVSICHVIHGGCELRCAQRCRLYDRFAMVCTRPAPIVIQIAHRNPIAKGNIRVHQCLTSCPSPLFTFFLKGTVLPKLSFTLFFYPSVKRFLIFSTHQILHPPSFAAMYFSKSLNAFLAMTLVARVGQFASEPCRDRLANNFIQSRPRLWTSQ